MGNVRVSQAKSLVGGTSLTPLRVGQVQALTAFRLPAPGIRVGQGIVTIAGKSDIDLRVSQATAMVAWRGRIENRKLRAWTFSLDGHDFYVLRLGDAGTLVYDTYSEQWMDWDSAALGYWRLQCGTNWFGALALASANGSNIVGGDDTLGLLWFLDPDQPFDDNPDGVGASQYFTRITMGQVPLRGREVLPCYAVWLTTDMGAPAYVGAGVKLEISDDAGATFDDMGTVTVTAGKNSPELAWYSLGQIAAPGRLFKLTDDGAIARIDGMEMNDPDDED